METNNFFVGKEVLLTRVSVSKVSAKAVEERELFVNERRGVACRRERAVNNEMLLVKINTLLFCYNNTPAVLLRYADFAYYVRALEKAFGSRPRRHGMEGGGTKCGSCGLHSLAHGGCDAKHDVRAKSY